ncbi:MAG TPA: helix-turn-helix domain-containing protein [Flavihumibacter sp.]|nr:TetR/AcrR family transcriptional regulator [Bacteroidota bacterium]HOA37697.1 helix-turn-helix domain-containing protein [Flavihumibacter sp.]HPZ87165.1 helix-turn-helix domain-containing protein [Flavihumibacter sp.]HQD08526.1 helix-turn-helix domain-containing protein [Flavihumibacter sp.]
MEPDQKDRILIKARDLFLQFGIRSVSMDDIASSLGVSKKTIYHYFADKDELVMGVMQQKMEESQAICVRDQQQAGDAIAELMRAMDAIDEHLSAMNPAVLFDLKKYHPLAFQMLEKHKNDFLMGMIQENLRRGIQEGLYRPNLHVDVIAKYRIESMLISFEPAFYTKHKLSMADMERILLEHFLFGIVTIAGYELILKYQQQRQKT